MTSAAEPSAAGRSGVDTIRGLGDDERKVWLKMDKLQQFEQEVRERIRALGRDADLQALSRIWLRLVAEHQYTYNFKWLGRPIIQLPQDIVALQELVWDVRPDCIIETGVAHGGSLILHASLLELLGGDRCVIGIDIDIRAHNRAEIEKHALFPRIRLVQGSSIAPETVAEVQRLARPFKRVMVLLDSNHTEEHVLRELELYSPLVQPGSYLIVYDTVVEDLPDQLFADRPWGRGNNPKTAVHKFLATNRRFEIDADMHNKLLLTAAPDGYLRCIG